MFPLNACRRGDRHEELEPAVKPLVDSLNAVPSIRTVASCQGHAYGKPPYVYFKAPTSAAAMIERLLREAAFSDCPALHADWIVCGLFDGDYEQTFLLHSPEYHHRAKNVLQALWLFGVRRKRLNADLRALAALLSLK